MDWEASQFAAKLGGVQRQSSTSGRVKDFVQEWFFWHPRGQPASSFQLAENDIFPVCLTGVPILDLSRYNLTDRHLREIARSGRFREFRGLMLSNNPSLTGQGLSYLSSDYFPNLETLNLCYLNLGDADLERISLFSQLKNLGLIGNPRLTGRAVAHLARGSAALVNLELSGCSQITRTGLEEWFSTSLNFPHLKALGLRNTDITPNDLERIIRNTEWFRRLSSIDLRGCDLLGSFPSNILDLHSLEKHEVAIRQSAPFCLRNGGLCFSRPQLTAELLLLILACRAYGHWFGWDPGYIPSRRAGTSELKTSEPVRTSRGCYGIYDVPALTNTSFEKFCRISEIALPYDDPVRMAALRAACVRYEISF